MRPPGGDKGQWQTGGAALILWATLARRAQTLWEQSAFKGTRQASITAQWLPGTDCVVAVSSVAAMDAPTVEGKASVQTLLFGDVNRDAHLRTLMTSNSSLSILAARNRPIAVVTEQISKTAEDLKSDHEKLSLLDERGRLRPSATFQASVNVQVRWKLDDRTLTVSTYDRIPTPPGVDAASVPPRERFLTKWSSLDSDTGVVTPLADRPVRELPPPRPAVPPPALSLLTRPIPIPEADGKIGGSSLGSLWLKAANTDEPELMLAADATKPILAPDLRAVLYESHHAIYAVPLVKMPGAKFGESMRAAMQRRTMMQAKQIGLALQMYALDYDGQLPPSANTTDIVQPYLRDSDVFNSPVTNSPSFHFLLNGDLLSSLGLPANVRLGTLAGPDDQAIIFGDGHVAWEDIPAKRP